MKDNDIPVFLAQAFTRAPQGAFSIRQKQLISDISQFVGADLFGLYVLEKELYPLATLLSQPKEKMVREYEYYRHQDPLFHYLLQQGGAVEGIELLGEEQWLRNPIGQLLQRWQMQYTIQGAISVQGKIVGTLNFARAPNAGRFDTEDTAKVAALCHEVSTLLTGQEPLTECNKEEDWPANTFITSAKKETTEATLITDVRGKTQRPLPSEIATLGFQVDALKQIIISNIQALQSNTHQLIERTIFTPNKKCFALTTLPLPGIDLRFVTIIKRVHHDILKGSEGKPLPFGERTQQALHLLMRGYSNKLIAREMGVSENTVKDHIKRIYRYFGVTNRTELAWRMRRQGR
ncbi:MAG: helix-turn-helix transcriptional regulator [Pseudomonadales bacterium]|nr:helix-turn-helix transcriptional regulator [Pseudomonadales bacterium]